LDLTACIYDEDHIGKDEDTEYDPKDDPPLTKGLLRCQHADDVRRDDTGERADTVHQRHQSAGVVGTEIQPVDFHPGIEGTCENSTKR
ncbi:hypothetical protein X777_12447, partial [Ooceraea biroi]